MFNLINDNLALMLTGCTMSFFGGFFYKATNRAFISRGKYRDKHSSLIIFLISILLTGLITIYVQTIWENIAVKLTFFELTGWLLILGMLGVNSLVKKWKYDDSKSVFIYSVGFLLIIFSKLELL